MAIEWAMAVPARVRAHATAWRSDARPLAGGCVAPLSLRQSFDPCPDFPDFPHVTRVDSYDGLRAVGRLRLAQRVALGQAPALSIGDASPYRLDLSDFVGAVNLCTHDGPDVTAALRVSLLFEHHPGEEGEALALCAHLRGLDERVTLVCTQLVRQPGHCGGHLDDLIRFVAIRAGRAGYRHCLVPAPERLVPNLSRLGFGRTGQAIHDADGGRRLVMVLETAPAPTGRHSAPRAGP